MSRVVYHIVEHDGGWAYRVEGTFSETFPNREAAHAAAERAGAEQRAPGDDVAISYEDEGYLWREEQEPGADRPETSVED
jgi:hypothetical protein